MKEDGKETKKRTEEEKKKKSRTKKPVSYGGLPDLKDAKHVTTDSDSGVARSMDGVAVAPGMHQMGGFPGMQPGMARPSHYGAKMPALPPGMFAPLPQEQEKAEHTFHMASEMHRGEPNGWKFDDVPTLPEFHPLERTAVFAPHSNAPEVGRRVADVLRARSIATVYDDKKAKAKCITEDNVEFRVRLYRGRNKFSHGIIVEVQRRFGFSPSFAGDMYAILDAAEGKLPALKTVPLIPPPSKLIPVVSDADDDDFDDFDAPPPSMGIKRKARSASLCIASDMLKRAKTADANVLALESLASITNSKKMGAAAALRVSRQILAGSDEGEDVREVLVSLLVDESLDSESTSDIWDKDDEGRAQLRLYAMTVLSNAISVAAEKGSPALLKDQSFFLADEIMPVLVNELRDSKNNSRMAVVSARCLESLLTSNAIGRDMTSAAIGCKAGPALEISLDVGQRGNQHLEDLSMACLRVLS
uniref:Uncharacterized protein n=1 Tax=Odontella aurita TaxID=265563 RepID=A0A7S4JK64_9STRA|mmetsp:Transcript_47818/g.144618  ORF Transcript_47818/g.144618 Transcript_47818/m.144618 type:complete len:474 (+) Transcript_47818:100-1521(+)|eukprot:CAMPEP_0113568026 /NCGR_PEP_ID=MMETSP0015_2-20120614/23611_1 /TAXON_ID=2838 /ORGANISM="Odontella" /LENGTH=473 /DNA_ID=CAMNT_0000470503 /DNA_START=52 /DNA_END=1473 /DNA_ORIENTATION=- /assembly_acc=CAM_ASM_000160